MLLFKLSMCVKSYQQRHSKRFREGAEFPKCETSEGLCAKARDFKVVIVFYLKLTNLFFFFFFSFSLPAKLASTSLCYMQVVLVLLIVNY